MSKTLEEEIQDSIKKNLPAQVGAELQKVLAEHEENKVKLANSTEKLEATQLALADSKAKITILEESLKKAGNLLEREHEVEKAEKNLKVTILETKLEEAEKRADMVRDFTTGLVRNTSYRKSIFDSETNGQPVVDGQGNTVWPMPTNKSHTETGGAE